MLSGVGVSERRGAEEREHCDLGRSLVWSLTLDECLNLTLFPINEKYYLSIQCSVHFYLSNFVLMYILIHVYSNTF